MKRLPFVATAPLRAVVILAILALSGCRAFYENSGSNIDVGDTTVPLRLKEPTSNFDMEFLFSLTGARVWTARDSSVTTRYKNTYTNAYFGVVNKTGVQDFEVIVEPCETSPTNSIPQ